MLSSTYNRASASPAMAGPNMFANEAPQNVEMNGSHLSDKSAGSVTPTAASFTKDLAPQNHNADKLIVGVDFGTTYSG